VESNQPALIWPIERLFPLGTHEAMQPDTITQLVAATFAELGTCNQGSITRTILLRKGFFVGYQFRCGEKRAVWFADSDEIKFHDAEGKLVHKIEQAEPMKKAA
jgi:hypothetical protein